MSVLGVVGAAVGFYLGGPSGAAMGYSIGSGVDSIVNAPDRVGPRLEDLRVQLSQYGAMVPFEWGTNRHAGTIIWPRILEAIEHREEESAKGGPDNVTFNYTISCAVLICEGPIAGVRRIWANKKIVYDVSADNQGETRDPAIGAIRFHLGTEDQGLDPLIEATDGEGPAYRGYAYVVFEDYDVTDLAGRPPQWEFEVITDGDTELDPGTTWGEAYGITPGAGQYDSTFEADMDSNGHLWLHSMSGHATVDAVTGQPVIDPNSPPKPQIHEYDAKTGELLWFYDVPPVVEDEELIYPIEGTGLCSGGFYFIGRGRAGYASPNASSYVHGLAVNCETHAVSEFVDQCSSSQFQNAGYFPAVPIPLIDNNKVYFGSRNGAFGLLGVGFMPMTIGSGAGEIDPIPDRTGAEARWNIPGGWHQARVKGSCPTPNDQFDGVAITLPGYAYKSTLLSNGAVVVQGAGESSGSYVMWASHAPMVDGFDLSPPSHTFTVTLPGSSVTMPPIAWDPVNEVLWAFAGNTKTNTLYAITAGGSINATGFVMPEIVDDSQGAWVRAMSFDDQTGLIRIVRGSSSNTLTALLDPINGVLSDETPMGSVAPSPGKMWSVPNSNKVIFANGYKVYSLPAAPDLAPNAVQLSQIVADICERAGLEAGDIDVSDLTDQVDGYIVPRQMTARAAIEPLQQAFFFDAVESDDKVKFVKRGKSTSTLIPLDDRAAHELGQEIPAALTVTRAFELELPVQCDVEYPDIEADHLVGNQSDRRITKDTRHNLNLQLPVVMTAEKAKSVARTLLYEAWQNQTFKFATSRKYAHLEPTDIVDLPTDAALYRGRITSKREQPNGVIEWEARVEALTVYTQSGEGAAPTGHVPQTIFVPGITQLELMDIPLLRDEDDSAGYYVAMGAL